MSRKNRERIQRIIAGKEKSISESIRKQKHLIVPAVTKYLSRGSTANEIDRLREMLHSGVLPASKLKKVMTENAIKEMGKGIKKLKKQGREPTVELLLEDYNKELAFQELCNELGLDRTYFEELARRTINESTTP